MTPDETHQSLLDAYALIRAHMARDIPAIGMLVNGATIVNLLNLTVVLINKLADEAETTPELFMEMWQALGVAEYMERHGG